MTVHQKHDETLRDFLARFRSEVAEIQTMIDELAINYLAAGIDKLRHGLILKEFLRKILEHCKQPCNSSNTG